MRILPHRKSFGIILVIAAFLGSQIASCTSPPALPTRVISLTGDEVQGLQTGLATAPVLEKDISKTASGSDFHWPGADWPTARPESRRIDPQSLDALLEAVPERAPFTTSLLVIRSGDMVLEKYFGAGRPEVSSEIYSCTKSFIATLVGIAIDRGLISSKDDRLLDYLPGRRVDNPDPGKDAMTLEHVLTMTTGLDWKEGDPAIYSLYSSPDWVQVMLDLPMLEAPGTRFNYCSGCSHLLSAVLEEATGMNTLDFANRMLFEPMGISDVEWLRDSQGSPIGGWGLQLTPREMARLGYLYLRGGVWEGRQVVSAARVEAAVTSHVKAEEKLNYGYQWWVRPSIQGYAALGRGGQMIAVIPEKDLVVVFTSSGGDGETLFQLIEDYLLPAVK